MGSDLVVEDDRPATGLLSILMTALVALLIIVGIMAGLILWKLAQRQEHAVLLDPPSKDLLELKQQDADQLSNYLALDAAADVYQVPIERAMDILVKRGSVDLESR